MANRTKTLVALVLLLVAQWSAAQDDTGCWFTRAPLPTARQEIQHAVLNGKIYVVGGIAAGNIGSTTVELFDPVSNTWSTAAPLPEPLHHLGLAVSGSKIYVVGGFKGNTFQPSDHVYEYDPGTDAWTQKTSLPAPRGALTAAEFNGKIYAIGGDSPGTTTRANESYDPATDSWQTLTDMPTAREHLASAVVGNLIYVVGGRVGKNNTPKLEAYSPATDTWTTLPSMPTARSGLTAAALNGKIFVFGGEIPGVYPQNEQFDPISQTWRAMKDMPTPRHGIGSAVFGNAIYIIGGGPVEGFGRTNVNEAFTLELLTFDDDFDDDALQDWNVTKPQWNEAGGVLTGTAARKAEIFSILAACACCKVDTSLQILTAQSKATILAFFQNKANHVELTLDETRDKWKLRHHRAGSIVASMSIPLSIVPGNTYHVVIEYTGSRLQISIDGVLMIDLASPPPHSGTLGFRLKARPGTVATLSIPEIHIH